MTGKRHLARRPRGFTLLELGIVIGVAAILAAAIVPDFIEAARTRMAEKAAEDVAVIHDAARMFFIENQAATGLYRWPGEQDPATGLPAQGTCLRGLNQGIIGLQLFQGGFLASGNPANPNLPAPGVLTNPWGQGYTLDLIPPVVGGVPRADLCQFQVTTNVPAGLARSFVAFLPRGDCNGLPGFPGNCPPAAAPLPTGFVRCCSFASRPQGLHQACLAGQRICACLDGGTPRLRCQGVATCQNPPPPC